MAEPFSLLAASSGLVEQLLKCGIYVKKILERSTTLDKDVLSLVGEIDTLIAVNRSLQDVYEVESTRYPATSLADRRRIESLWYNVGILVKNCQTTVAELRDFLLEIIGKTPTFDSKLGDRLSGKVEVLKKTMRMERRETSLKNIHTKLLNFQNSLQVLLSALSVAYARSSQDSTDVSLSNITQEIRLLGSKLRSDIASLRPKLVSTNSTDLLDALDSATAVGTLISINKHFYIPQPVSSIFTGRKKMLLALQTNLDIFGQLLSLSRMQKRFIIYGLGGSGKTQFVCKFAQDSRQEFWGIFSIDASSQKTAEHSFSNILKIAKIEASEGSSQRAAIDWLSSLEYPWLLIIDNADDPSHPLETYFPSGERGCIIVTTRDPMKKIHGTVGPRFYHFEKLETGEANDLLLRAACRPTPWDIPTLQNASCIVATLGCLPLALIQAGKAILNKHCSLSNYIDHYNKSWHRIRRARGRSRSGPVSNSDTINWNVYSSYEINLKNLEESSDEEALDAMQLLKMFSCFHYENLRIDFLIAAAINPTLERQQQEANRVEEERMGLTALPKTWGGLLKDQIVTLAEAITRDRGPAILPSVLRDIERLEDFDEARLRQALGRLSRMSLITQQDSTDACSMHPLVHTWVRERSDMNLGEEALWCQAAYSTLAQAIMLPPYGSSEKEEEMRRNLLPHIDHVRECQLGITSKIIENQKQRKLRYNLWFPPIKSRFGRRQALESAKFSRVYQECGLWAEAEQLQLAVKNFVCEKLGEEHPAATGIKLFLSATYWNQARTNEAADLQEQVYHSCLKSLGPQHPRTLKVMDTLGSSKCFQGRYKESLELHEQAIAGMKASKYTKEEDLYIAMGNMGRILLRYFRYEEAKTTHSQALDGLRRILGNTHLQTLIAMEDLAMSYLDCGEQWHARAHELMAEVLSQRESRLGKEQPFTLLAICNLARVKSAMGAIIEAEAMFRGAIPIAERSLGANHFGTLAGYVHFAQILVKQKRFDEAESIFVKVVEKQRYASAAREDGDHPDRILALWYLVQCYELHGNLDDALVRVTELERVVSTIGGEGLGKLHPFAQKVAAKRLLLECAREEIPSSTLSLPEDSTMRHRPLGTRGASSTW